MGENKIINLFEQAITKNELFEFAIGKGEYFILDREYGEHWIHGSWVNFILPFIKDKGELKSNKYILGLFESIIDSDLELEKKGDILVYHLHVYYYFKTEQKLHTDALKGADNKLRIFLLEYYSYLININKAKSETVKNAINLIKSRGGLSTVLI